MKKWEGSKADKVIDKKQKAKEGSKKDNAIDKKMQSKLSKKKVSLTGKQMLTKAVSKLNSNNKAYYAKKMAGATKNGGSNGVGIGY